VENHFAADFIKVLSGSELLMMKRKGNGEQSLKELLSQQ